MYKLISRCLFYPIFWAIFEPLLEGLLFISETAPILLTQN